jgi:hypothetical protein
MNTPIRRPRQRESSGGGRVHIMSLAKPWEQSKE